MCVLVCVRLWLHTGGRLNGIISIHAQVENWEEL